MNREELLFRLANECYSFRSEGFKLSSGNLSCDYFDCRAFLGNPEYLSSVSQLIAHLISPAVSAVGGLTMGADPLSIAISLRMLQRQKPISWFSIRKEKKEHGQEKNI